MPIFEVEANGKTFEIDAPDQNAAVSALQGMPGQNAPSPVADFFRSIPRGIMSGALNAGGALAKASALEMGQPDMADTIPMGNEATAIVEKNVTGELPKPAGRAGRFGAAIGEGLGNPATYVGPGGMALKLGGSVLSSAAGEAAAQGAEGTKYEEPARIAGNLAGGIVAAKGLGPSTPKAAVPTYRELKTAANQSYNAARQSGLELHPQGPASWAAATEQELIGPNHGFTGGSNGVAPKTFGVLEQLQSPPTGATVSASNLDALRKNLGRIARETSEGKPTADAAAASIALERLNSYTENIPQSHIMAGDPAAYVRNTKIGNADYAAAQRVRTLDTRLTKAENAADRQIAGSLENQIKSKAGSLLDNPKNIRGMSPEEIAQLQLINSGDRPSNFLRQVGRGGAGVIPLMGQIAAAPGVFAAGGPIGLALQGGVAGALYGARKGSEAITKSRAEKLVEMLAKRSPEYERRVLAIPPGDNTENISALVRALIAH